MIPSGQHEQFDAICAQLDDFDPLPSVVRRTVETEQRPEDDERRRQLDNLILAGLVAP